MNQYQGAPGVHSARRSTFTPEVFITTFLLSLTQRIAVLTFLACALPLTAQTGPKPPLRSAPSSVRLVPRGGDLRGLVPRTENVRFTMTGHGPWDLYEEHFITQEGDGNCCFTHVSVTAYDVSRAGRQRKRWTVDRAGDSGELFGEFYQIFLGGCCGDANSYLYFHTATGKLVYESIQRLLQARVTYHDLIRYVAVLNDRSPGSNLKEGTSLMSYGAGSGVTQRFLLRFPNHGLVGAKLRGPDDKAESRSPDEKTGFEIELNGYRLPESPALLSGFSIELEFVKFDASGAEITVLVPVENDVMRVDRAKLPEGLTIEPLSMAPTDSIKRKRVR